jgi:hypothetical protein
MIHRKSCDIPVEELEKKYPDSLVFALTTSTAFWFYD